MRNTNKIFALFGETFRSLKTLGWTDKPARNGIYGESEVGTGKSVVGRRNLQEVGYMENPEVGTEKAARNGIYLESWGRNKETCKKWDVWKIISWTEKPAKKWDTCRILRLDG